MIRTGMLGLAALALAGHTASVLAATRTAAITLSTTVLKTCSVGATNVNFGSYVPGSGATLTGNSTISVRCTKGTPYTVALNVGATSGSTYAQRQMAWGTERLQYNLYTSTAYTTVFGDGTVGTGSGANTGTGLGTAAQTWTAYGRLLDSATNQNAAPNAGASTYTDTVTVTVTY